MNQDLQQALTILLGGVFIWGLVVGTILISFKVEKAKPFRTSLLLSAGIGALCGVSYLILAYVLGTEESKFAVQVPGVIVGTVAFMLVGFVSDRVKSRYYGWLMQWAKRRASEKRGKSE